MKQLFSIGLIVLLAAPLVADVHTNFGFGTEALGSAQSQRYSKKDLLSNYYTPAALTDWKEIKVAASLLYSSDQFKDLTNVVTDSKKYGASSLATGTVDTDTPDLSNLMLGIVIPSGNEKKAGLALFSSMPVGKFLSVETQSAFYPQYMMYQSDGQRMNAAVDYFWQSKSGVDYSLGLHMFFVTGSTVVSRFPSSTVGQPSSSNVDLKIDVKPAFAPSFSFRKIRDNGDEISLSFIGERDAKLAFNASNSINVFVSAIPIDVDGKSSLYYDPMQLSLSYKKDFPTGALSFGLEAERWSRFSSSVMKMQISGANTFEQLNIDQNFKDIITPRIGWQSHGDKSWWSVGYSYRQSPVKNSIDESNYLDSDRHVLGTSYSRSAEKIFGLIEKKHQWGVGFQVHSLKKQYITKAETDSVGYPGYEISGAVFTLAVHFQSEL